MSIHVVSYLSTKPYIIMTNVTYSKTQYFLTTHVAVFDAINLAFFLHLATLTLVTLSPY